MLLDKVRSNINIIVTGNIIIHSDKSEAVTHNLKYSVYGNATVKCLDFLRALLCILISCFLILAVLVVLIILVVLGLSRSNHILCRSSLRCCSLRLSSVLLLIKCKHLINKLSLDHLRGSLNSSCLCDFS